MKNFLVMASLMLASTSAFAENRFSIVGGVDYNLNSATVAGIEIKGGLGFGGGLLAELGKIELGALYLSKTVSTTVLGVSISASSSVIEIPVMYRIGHGTSFGIGGFVDLASSSNYGVTAGPRFGSANGGAFLDLRFNYGLKSGNSKDILAMVGYSFGGKKQ